MHLKISNWMCVVLLCGAAVLLVSCVSFDPEENKSFSNDNGYSEDIFEISDRALKAYRNARWQEAARLYQQLTLKVPDDAYVWFRLANTYVQQGEFDSAVDAYRASIARDSEQPKSWFNLSTTYMLNAKAAMLESWQKLRADDPARNLIQQRIDALDKLLNEKINPIRVNR